MLLARQDLFVDKVFRKAENELGGHLRVQAVVSRSCVKLVVQAAWAVSGLHTWQFAYGSMGAKILQGSDRTPQLDIFCISSCPHGRPCYHMIVICC